jgi:exodeoxyribonuclease V gamma subunit
MLGDRLAGTARRPDFFRGGVTVSSLTPLRWLPYRVVCILGLDEAGGGGSAPDGDDLGAAVPALGDRDPRAEARQALLEAVLAAGDHLVITRNGHNVRTNQEVPLSVAFAELRDVVADTLAAADRRGALARIEWTHPRQAFDERNLRPDALGTPGPWTFDRLALAAATARRSRTTTTTAFLTDPLPAGDETVIATEALRAFFRHPVRSFLVDRLGIRIARTRGDDDGADDELPVRVAGLDAWGLGDRLITARRAGASPRQWERA